MGFGQTQCRTLKSCWTVLQIRFATGRGLDRSMLKLQHVIYTKPVVLGHPCCELLFGRFSSLTVCLLLMYIQLFPVPGHGLGLVSMLLKSDVVH